MTNQQKNFSTEALKLARQTLISYLENGFIPKIKTTDPKFKEKRAAFVTLYQNNQLRGCIGLVEAILPLEQSIQRMAVDAATKDPRFPAVRANELKNIKIEISILSPPQKIKDPAEIQLGRDGIIMETQQQRGVFLPQVATDNHWTKEEFLSNLCIYKLGLDSQCWRWPASKMFIFQSEIISE